MRSIHEKIAASALALYGHEGVFEIGFNDAAEAEALCLAFEKLGCKVMPLSPKNLLSVAVPAHIS